MNADKETNYQKEEYIHLGFLFRYKMHYTFELISIKSLGFVNRQKGEIVDITSNLLFIQCHLLFVDLQNVVILTVLSSAFYRLLRISPKKTLIYLPHTKQRLNSWT